MSKSSRMSMWLVAALAVIAAFAGSASPALAQNFQFTLPAGEGCEFPLAVDVEGSERRVVREFTDANGNVVRTISAGVGNRLTFTNLATGETLTLRPNGAVTHTVYNADGTRTERVTGHNVVILFPTDEPAGPSTTLHIGRVVYTVAAGEMFTIRSTSGRAIDICAALS